ncbi:membrane protein [Kitasatospora sp. NE20-6]|uniref:bestrophin-like domain n=1 Tax=Kitasatospora sp. NE20-6 TaxID=2859066 RepID=UPI0034DC9A09
MSEWLALAIAMTAACLVVVAVVVLRQRRVGEDDDPSETPDVIEYITMMIGVVYAIVLGLAIAGVWETRSAAQDELLNEAQALHEISARAEIYPADFRARVRGDVDAYVSFVVDTEWSYMKEKGEISPRGTELLDRLRQDVASRVPQSDLEAQVYQPVMDRIAATDESRTARGQSTGPSMPGVVWFGLIVGAVVTVGMMFALQIRRSARELVLAGTFSALIAFLLFLIWDFDDPFGRGISVTTQPFLDLFPSLN